MSTSISAWGWVDKPHWRRGWDLSHGDFGWCIFYEAQSSTTFPTQSHWYYSTRQRQIERMNYRPLRHARARAHGRWQYGMSHTADCDCLLLLLMQQQVPPAGFPSLLNGQSSLLKLGARTDHFCASWILFIVFSFILFKQAICLVPVSLVAFVLK